MKAKKIVLIGSQHGDERLGGLLFAYISKHHKELLPSVVYILANPRAYEMNVRYLESDMNRSYVDTPQTYEERQANHLAKRLREEGADVILDLHTTRCIQPPSYIVYKPNAAARRFMEASSIEVIVHMDQHLARRSLIGVNNAVVSIEVQNDTINDDLLEEIIGDIYNYQAGILSEKTKVHFEIMGHIYKDEITKKDAALLENFQLSRTGYYPVLTGNNSYKKNTNYIGFKAKRRKDIT